MISAYSEPIVTFSDGTTAHVNETLAINNRDDIDEANLANVEGLNEACLMNNLLNRFHSKKTMTSIGETLITIAPSSSSNTDYKQEQLELLMQLKPDEYFPHVYSTVLKAVNELLLPQSRNQIVIFHGENEESKREALSNSLKCIFYCFKEKIGKNSQSSAGMASIEVKIAKMNTLLDAFGNAKTRYCDNSQRYGKNIQIKVDATRSLIYDAFVLILPLESSRITHVNEDERNYHIFYYLLQGGEEELIQSLGLTSDIAAFSYLKNTQTQVSSLTNSKDKEEYAQLIDSFVALEFNKEEIEGVMKVLAVILLLGNIQTNMTDEQCPMRGDEVMKVSNLLKVNRLFLQMVLTRKPPSFGSKEYGALYKEEEIKRNIDIFAQELYCKLFDWIVKKSNFAMTKPLSSESDTTIKCIGLVDCSCSQASSHSHSPDQLGINYVNEQIHQLFLRNCFERDKSEYRTEGIEDHCKDVTYRNNIEVIRQLKLFIAQTREALRDEQIYSIAESFKAELAKSKTEHKGVYILPASRSSSTFSIHHSHGDIEYSARNFVRDNTSELKQGLIDCILSSSNPLIQCIYSGSLSSAENIQAKEQLYKERLKPDPKKRMQRGITSAFLIRMKEFKAVVKKCNQHYILCLNPNKVKDEMAIWPNYIYQQLQYLNIPSLISFNQESYSVSYFYEQFSRNNQLIINSRHEASYHQLSQLIIEQVLGSECNYEGCRFGKSKLFMKSKFNKAFIARRNSVLKHKELLCDIIKGGICYLRLRAKFNDVRSCVKNIQDSFLANQRKKKLKDKRQKIEFIQAAYQSYRALKAYCFIQSQFSIIQPGLKILIARKHMLGIKCKSAMIAIRVRIFLKRLKKQNKRCLGLLAHQLLRKSIHAIEKAEYSALWKHIEPFVQMRLAQRKHNNLLYQAKATIVAQKQFAVLSLFQQRNFLFKLAQQKKLTLNIGAFSKTLQWSQYYSLMRHNTLLIQAYLKRAFKRNVFQAVHDDYFKQETLINKQKELNDFKTLFPKAYVPQLDSHDSCLSFFGENDSSSNVFTEEKVKAASSMISPSKERLLNPSSSGFNSQCCTLFNRGSNNYAFKKPKIRITTAILDYDLICNNEAYSDWAKEYAYYNDINSKSQTPLMIIKVGNTHTLALNSKGKVFAWGWNDYGQCGAMIKDKNAQIVKDDNGSIIDLPAVYYQSASTHIAKSIIGQCAQVVAGEDYSLLLSTNGNVYSMGNNSKGQLGVGTLKMVDAYPIQMNKINGDIHVIKGIYSAGSFNAVLTNDNKLMAWYISKNKLAIKPMRLFLDKRIVIRQIACGKNFMIVLSQNGLVYGSGTNAHGELSLEGTSTRIMPEEITSLSALRENIIQISSGFKHVIALSSLGKAYGWGNNSYGQLGHSNTKDNCLTSIKLPNTNKIIQIACGFRCSIFLSEARGIYYTGRLSNENQSKAPMFFDMKLKSMEYSSKSFSPVRLLSSWNQSFSIFYASLAEITQLMQNNVKEVLIEEILSAISAQWLQETVDVPHIPQYSSYIKAD